MKLLLACLIFAIHGSFAQNLIDPECMKFLPHGSSSKIYGGTSTDLLRNPWMVQILQIGYHMCGGSLITSQFVLTAAHCKSNYPMKVRLGGCKGGKPKYECTSEYCNLISTEIDVAMMFSHPQYNEYHEYDIALILMAESVLYNAQIRPICLMKGTDIDSQWRFLKYVETFNVTGWGKTEWGENSNELQLANLYQLDKDHCSQLFRRNIDMPHICAGQSKASTCIGDSGGPLSAVMTFSDMARPFLFGLTSYGAPGCRAATVFTNVLSYSDWIEYIVENHTPRTALLRV
ncbi:trypsin-7 [Drosophila elegans]|uniref:trypsin-7 n=1 Tax=Drosophila elegans TaxID=30023 RepID=UPI0007E75F1C|nr:trypsin-7 [Drosophila elegans]